MSAENVYNFIDECLKYIKDTKTTPSTIPVDADIQIIESSLVLPTIDVTDVPKTKETLKLLLTVIGYDATKNPIFLKKPDSSKSTGYPAEGYWAINIDTGNAWEIKEYKPSPLVYGGKKRKTNRRKHRRSNRKTLGRKK
jgi:hypothetical protein